MHVTVRLQGVGASLLDTQAAELRMLTTRLWDSVARVADGRQVDAEDSVVLERARLMLKGESQTLLAVRDDYQAAAPWELQGSYPGQGSFTDLILRAAEDHADIPDLRTTPIDRINVIVSVLDKIAHGDVEVARTYDRFFEYL